MASYHLSVKTIKRSEGRSATAAAAYRAGERIECLREGRLHDYTAKQGIEETFIVAPDDAPVWASDRAALWNAAEERETRRNSVTAREWELALPSEINAEARAEITRAFAQELVDRYGVAVDVAIHAPNREGDQRNHHAHVLTTTRRLEPDGLGAKTRVLDAARTGGVENRTDARCLGRIAETAPWSGQGSWRRVDHRSLEAQREAALEQGDGLTAEELDRDPEVKLGPVANAMERREMRDALREGREYVPVTERGAVVQAARQARAAFQDMRERLDLAREAYGLAREEGQGRVSAGLAALRAAVAKEGQGKLLDGIKERLAEIVERDQGWDELEADAPARKRENVKDRLGALLDRSKSVQVEQEREGPELEEEKEKERGRDFDDGYDL